VSGNSMSGTFSVTATRGGSSGTATCTFTVTRSGATLMAPAGRLVRAVIDSII
jgi:uncharacterized protein YjdB